MNLRLLLLVLPLAAGVTAAAQSTPTALTETLKKVTARYARTEERIADLVGSRLHPRPLPAELPNPFYQGVEMSELAAPDPVEELVPEAPDISDADTLTKIAPTLRFSGLAILNSVPHVSINSIFCKAGDFIPIPGRTTPTFIQIRQLSRNSVTLGLNDAEITLSLKLE